MPSRNGKLRLSRELFATALDPERGWPPTAPIGEAARLAKLALAAWDGANPTQIE